MKIKSIITGASGMVGEGVLIECLQHPDVEEILVISRKPIHIQNPKLNVLLHADFYNLSTIEDQLKGYNACFFCLGVSSIGLNEADYHKLTYDLTIHVATTLSRINDDMTFCYVSGVATDSTEKGRSMWARVKGKTENALMQLPFRKAYMFRPGYLHPTDGMKNALKYYTYFKWLYPSLRFIFPRYFCSLKELGLAMIHTLTKGSDKQILEVKDIVELSKD
jgi:uncharacterized protein YbjT (DUF2867 family)